MTAFKTNPVLERQMFVYAHAKLTVWIRQCSNNSWEAIDWYGKVLATSKYRAEIEREIVQQSQNRANNIYGYCIIVPPGNRVTRKPKGMRRG